ncbi:hypothetical protein ACLM5H_11040 [Fredinandcohnia humi]
MSRSFERKIMYVASAWQLITGTITVFFYSIYLKNQGAELGDLSIIEQKGIQSYFDSLYSFSVMYGLFFILIGALNIIFVMRMVKDNTLQYKLPIYWIILAIAFYFLSDFISLTLTLIAAVIALAKNKPIKAAEE